MTSSYLCVEAIPGGVFFRSIKKEKKAITSINRTMISFPKPNFNSATPSLPFPIYSLPRLATAPQLAPGTVDRGPSSRQPDTSSSDGPRAEHGCVPVHHVSTQSQDEWVRVWGWGRRDGRRNLNISGTIKNLTCEPRMYTWSRWDTRPSRAVTVMSLSWTFILSSAVLCC